MLARCGSLTGHCSDVDGAATVSIEFSTRPRQILKVEDEMRRMRAAFERIAPRGVRVKVFRPPRSQHRDAGPLSFRGRVIGAIEFVNLAGVLDAIDLRDPIAAIDETPFFARARAKIEDAPKDPRAVVLYRCMIFRGFPPPIAREIEAAAYELHLYRFWLPDGYVSANPRLRGRLGKDDRLMYVASLVCP